MAAMAKKTKSAKKHRFKHVEPSSGGPAAGTATVKAATVASSAGPAPAVAPAQEARFVAADLRRILILLLGLVGLELVLWYLLGHTSLDPALYDLIQV